MDFFKDTHKYSLSSYFLYVNNFVNNDFSSYEFCALSMSIFVFTNDINSFKMLGTLIKKRLSDNQVANIFVNALFDVVDKGFNEVASLINEDPAFVVSPNIQNDQDGEFALIVIVGNLSFIESLFEPEQAHAVEKLIFEKLAKVYEMSVEDFTSLIREYQSFMSRKNHPSKNMIYAMSKSIFHKYDLNNFQDEYFKRMQAPNPLFLKRMDEVVQSFIWDWDAFFKKYKM
ncbi:MAG: hypothetical protein V4622_12470 [Bacteroidota bacterium]